MLERRGIGLEVMTPAYGLAEATLAVTLNDSDAAPRFVSVDPDALSEGRARIVDLDQSNSETARRVVSCGTPVDGLRIRVDDASGEIVVSGPTLAAGYHRDSKATKARFRDGELWTGDLGFIDGEELFVIGRSDDIVIIGGRNVHAVEIEDALGGERGIRKGNCAIVDLQGEQGTEIAVVAELAGDGIDAHELAIRLRQASIAAAGVPIDRAVFLPKGLFPKTPSGKAQRYRCRAIAQEPPIATEVVNLGAKRSAT
jgi:acyl-CoA synthetase (AMP-forming)/AMP-acid ligase II